MRKRAVAESEGLYWIGYVTSDSTANISVSRPR
jgi:hypothetical protein